MCQSGYEIFQSKQMDLQKLRPTKNQWHGSRLSVTEGSMRPMPQPIVASTAKHLTQPPKGKGGPLWKKFYDEAVARKHPMPEKLADTLLRSREHALELEAQRRKILVTTETPKPIETAAVNPKKTKTKVVVSDALRCKALTLEGRRCGFKATCGEFCKKHAVEEKM